MNGARLGPRTPQSPPKLAPKDAGLGAKVKTQDQRLSRGIHCNGKYTGSAKGWMCADFDLLY